MAAARFIPQLEALRGIAAICVVAEHSFITKWGYRTGIFDAPRDLQEILNWIAHTVFPGRSAVILFFVLSGFVLKMQWDNLPGPAPIRLASYSIRRCFRLLPALWFSIAFAWALALVSGHPVDSSMAELLRTFAMQSISINPPIWSIIAEIQCSLFLPVLLFFDRRAGTFGRAAILLLLIGAHYALNPEPYLRYAVFFYVGILIHHWGPACCRLAQGLVISVCLAVIGLAPQIWVFDLPVFKMTDNWAYQMVLAVPCFVLVAAVAYRQSPWSDALLLSRPARFVGRISFSLYLVHYMIAQALWPSFHKLFAPLEQDSALVH
jgi:peptidoglycan/LPS O-acetylase OafA/YrhL